MKAKISLIALLGLLVFGAVSCKKNDSPSDEKGIKIDQTSLQLKPGEDAVLTATITGLDGTIDWSVDPAEGVVTLDPAGAGSTKCGVKADAEGDATITATCGDFKATCTVTVKKEDIKTPDVAGEAGKYTIAFRVPETACIGDIDICLFGDFQGNDPKDESAPIATKIEQSGFDNWYKLVFEAEDASTAKGKICPIAIDGTRDWNWQGETYTLIKGNGEIIDDYGTQNKIVCNAVGEVVYVDVVKWASDPCVAPFPGGDVTFSVILTNEFPEDFDPSTIQIAVAHWDAGQDELTYDFTYTGGIRFTGTISDFPAGQQYKYNIQYTPEGGEPSGWIWEKGGNRDVPFDGITNDEVAEWEGEPWNPIPGGEGTFKITFSESCNMAQYEKVIFTGNFAEESWGESQREMTDNGDGSFSWTGEFPDNFQYKVIGRTEGAEDAWIGPSDNWKFDGATYEQEWTCE